MKSLAIIPARGGSKRIPGKNIKNFLGKPIISYSIQTALKSKLFDTVMVSTDSKEIAEVAESYGASIPFLRSNENSDDFATTVDVLIEVLNAYKKKGILFDVICCIYPTTPMIDFEALKNAYDKMINDNLDTVFPVLKFSYPPQRAITLDNDNLMQLQYPELKNTRSQDLEALYHDAGQFYWVKTAPFLKTKNLWPQRTGVVLLSEMDAQDIDNIDDWKLAELKYQIKNTDN